MRRLESVDDLELRGDRLLRSLHRELDASPPLLRSSGPCPKCGSYELSSQQRAPTWIRRCQRTVWGRCRSVHHPRVERDDDEAFVLELDGELRGRNHSGGLRHPVCRNVGHTKGLDGLRITSARPNDDDLLGFRCAEEREECADAVDRAKAIDLVLWTERGVNLGWQRGAGSHTAEMNSLSSSSIFALTE